MKNFNKENLGKNLIDLIGSENCERKEFDDVISKIVYQKHFGKFNFIHYKKKLTNKTIQDLKECGYEVFNPQRGVNYGKTWPGYRISWRNLN